MDDQYGMGDFRQFTDGRSNFGSIQATGDMFSGGHRNLTQAQHYEMVMMSSGEMVVPPPPVNHHHQHHLHQFGSDSTTTSTTNSTLNGLENMESGGGGGGDGGSGRWPRQETLTLLEIRSKLDPKFKEANQKGPLWDEVSRVMYEEHGYQRSGKKCREKFENLYKYYKKTKDGKAGRQDGKHYRFFRQLEALYGETNNPSSDTHLAGNNFQFYNPSNATTISNQEPFQAPKLSESLSLSTSSEFNSSSSHDNDAKDIDSMEKRKKRRGKRSWKAKISDFIDAQMRKLMEKQEEWLEKMMKSIERKEEERLVREEEWRKKEAARIEREHEFWANERAWIEARDAALMDALQKLSGKELLEAELRSLKDNHQHVNENGSETITNIVNADHNWPECEITKLIQLRDLMESRFQQSGCIEEEMLWDEIAAKMAYLGYDRSALMCKEKWDSINNYLRKTKECNKKRKENSRNNCYFPNHELMYNQGGAYCVINEQEGPHTTRFATNESASPPNSGAGNAMHDSCFRLLMGDGANLWENYGVKHNKGKNH